MHVLRCPFGQYYGLTLPACLRSYSGEGAEIYGVLVVNLLMTLCARVGGAGKSQEIKMVISLLPGHDWNVLISLAVNWLQ